MCFGPEASPPQPPRRGHLAATTRLTLSADDGTAFAATLAETKASAAPGVVILPDVRGLHPYYERLAEAFADAGAHALAVDLYGRTAGAEYRGDDFDYADHRAAARDATIRLDVAAAANELRARGAGDVFALGFCFGGRAAFMQASAPGIAGAIGFYGWPTRVEEGGSSPVDEARSGRVRAPVLAIYGGADKGIGPDAVAEYDRALADAGASHESVVYDGAPHSFFDRAMGEHAEACDDAWRRVLEFMAVAVTQR